MSRPPAPTNDEIRQLNAWLDVALDLDPAARAAWLAGPAVPPGRLREQLLAMLSGHDAPTEALVPAFPLLARDNAGAAPPFVGPYRLLRELGHGGMASVWLARAEGAPDDALVAVKLPHLHRRRPDFAQRLERERAILATLQHPGITRLLDAGVDQQGQPYLVLELVEGEPIDAWCRRRALALPQRLALWLQAADAVAHAHRQQVLHRDLKPSNLLVTADGRLRLLDFGIAKLLQDGWSVETDLTRQAGRPLTLEYASPEQVRGEPVGVASDVYSIGVVLYELLCNTRPHRLEGRPQAVFETEIVGSAPPLPSQVAADPETRAALAGDLDAVLMKALRKRMHERYRSVDAFADDVRRFLERRPVVAAAELDLPAARSAQHHRLPARDVSLVGRQVDLARVADLLRSARLVTLAGLGGVGKTELAHAVAVTLADEFVDGAIWVDLAVLHAGEQVAAATAAAAGVGLAGDAGTGQVRSALATRHALLVLDNCEHLLAPVAAFAEALLEGAPALRLLATSRERLGLAREQVVRLEPLALPPVTGDLALLRDSAAFQLLEQRVARADLNFRFDSGQALAGAQVCRALDGVPLALEMAAAWVPRLGLQGVLAMLQERPQMLQSTLRGPPLRQRSLDDLMDWSYGLLSAQEQQALRRLSAFSGEFEMAQAEGLLADEAVDRWQARALVASLVEKSLVTAGADGDSTRFRLLETTRGFAARRAEGAGESADIAQRHVRTMVQAARQVVAWFDDARSEATLTLGGERWYADLDLAFDRACAAGDADSAAVLLHSLRNLEALRGVLVAMGARVEAAMRLLPQASPKARAHILAVNASCGWLRGTGLSRTEAARQAVALQRSLSDDPDAMRYPLSLLAVNAALEGHAVEARDALQQAEALRDLACHPERKAMSLVYGAHVERYVGDRQKAVTMLFDALALALARGQHRFASYIRFHALEAAAAAGEPALVLEHAPGFIEAMRRQGQHEFLVLTCVELARAGMATGDLDATRIALAEALPIGPEVNRQHDVLGTLAAFALRRGQPRAAARLWGFVSALGAEPEAEPFDRCRAALAPAEFEHTLALGAAMSAETCRGLALDLLAEAAPGGLSPPPPPAARG